MCIWFRFFILLIFMPPIFTWKKENRMPQVLNPNDKNLSVSLSPNLFGGTVWRHFGSVRALEPVPLDADCPVYYYEVKVLFAQNQMQIGWATKECFLLDGSGKGVGDDRYSIGFDASYRSCIWHGTLNGTTNHPISLSNWTVGDIVGCLIDLEHKNFIFYLNGHEFDARKLGIDIHFSDMPYYPAVSFVAHKREQAYFNFGQQPFQFAPKRIAFRDFYGHRFNRQLQQSLTVGPNSSGTLALSCDALSVRNTSSSINSLETVFAMRPIDKKGVYFYEVRLLTDGFMKIGWANNEKSLSIGFDGYRKLIWLDDSKRQFNIAEATCWSIGDTLGCLIDLTDQNFIFYHNGKEFDVDKLKLNVQFHKQSPTSSYRPAIALAAGQQVYCNFGQESFRFPPKAIEYQDFVGNRFDQALQEI